MKGLLIGGATILSIVLGFWPGGTSRPKPSWWRWLTILSILILTVLGLGLPIGGTFVDGVMVSTGRENAKFPIRGVVVDRQIGEGVKGASSIQLRDRTGRTESMLLAPTLVDRADLRVGRDVIVQTSYVHDENTFTAWRLTSTDPWASLPLVPALEERARNIYFHVPTAWVAQLAWFVALAYAVVYLRKRRLEDDIRAATAAGLGALFCVLATTTGAVWAKFNWGVFWNWDPRQTSIFIVLVIYGAYFALRSALDGEDQRARISSIYLILLAVPVVFFMFVMPRLVESLHPGSKGEGNIGPVLSSDADALDPIKQVLFALSFFSFAMLFFWMLNVAVRARLVELGMRRRKVRELEAEDALTLKSPESVT